MFFFYNSKLIELPVSMALSARARMIISMVAIASAFACTKARAASNQKSWAERLGLLNYAPLVQFYRDYDEAKSWHLEEGPLLPYLPPSARNIYVTISKFQDLVISEYVFDKHDLRFFESEWTEIKEPLKIEELLDAIEKCPWHHPPPRDARYFKSSAHTYWGLSSFTVIEESDLTAWHYYSVPNPTKQSFCT